jgi:Pyruvate/2-oxoglutarate dehydrogenase complex, dehydrogenase (E1) component, eukaryotic type, alpha subunit
MFGAQSRRMLTSCLIDRGACDICDTRGPPQQKTPGTAADRGSADIGGRRRPGRPVRRPGHARRRGAPRLAPEDGAGPTFRHSGDGPHQAGTAGRVSVSPRQEAGEVGAVLALRPQDWLFPTYRDTMAVVCRGLDPVEVLSLLRGDWHCGYDPYEYRVAPQCTPLATNTLHAVGVAHAASSRARTRSPWSCSVTARPARVTPTPR